MFIRMFNIQIHVCMKHGVCFKGVGFVVGPNCFRGFGFFGGVLVVVFLGVCVYLFIYYYFYFLIFNK